MAATSFDPRNPIVNSHYGIPEIIPAQTEAASTDFKAGELVYFVGGAPTVCTVSTKVNGIALADSTDASPGAAEVPVQLIGTDDELQIRVASDASGTLALADTLEVGNDYAVASVSNLVYVVGNDTTGGNLVFVAPVYDAAGVSTNWGRFKVHSTLNFIAQIA